MNKFLSACIVVLTFSTYAVGAYTPVESGSGVYWSAQKDVINANFAALDTKNDSQDTLIAANTLKVGLTTDSVTPLMLVSDNALVDEYCFTYEASTGNFEMQVCGSGAGDDLGSATYSDVVALWTTCTSGYLKYDGSCDTPEGTEGYSDAEIDALVTASALLDTLDGQALAVASLETDPTSDPGIDFYNSDLLGTDKYAGGIENTATTLTDGNETTDVTFSFMKDGTETVAITIDGSENVIVPGMAISSGETIDGLMLTDVETASTHTFTAAECRGGSVLATVATAFTLPTAAAGLHCCGVSGQGLTAILSVTSGTGDYLVNDEGARTTTTAATLSSTSAAGNKFCATAHDDTDWYLDTRGTWAE